MRYIRFGIFSCLMLFSEVLIAQPDFQINYDQVWVDSVFQSLSPDEKIGQLLMPRANLSGKGYDKVKLEKWIREYKISGLVFFAGNPTEQAQLTNNLQAISKTPLIIGEDFEWGLSMRLDSTDRFPYQMTLGAMDGNEAWIEAMGAEIGRQCKAMGVHINYAPVVDVNNNPGNPVINFRSFGENKHKVTEKSLAYMRGLQSQNIIATAKHFPGHGDTDVDSHFDLPVIRHTIDRLHDIELYPFKKLINEGLSGIMTAHLHIPSLDPTPNLAATLSKPIITSLLRNELGYSGLIMTDAMDMQGVVKHYPNGEAAVRSLLAGNDLIETFEDVPAVMQAIRTAVSDGRITMQEIDMKVKRILKAKSWVGLNNYKPTDIPSLIAQLNTINSDVLNRKMAESTLTLLHNEDNVLPIRDLTRSIAVVSVDANDETPFQKMISNYVDADYFLLPKGTTDSIIEHTSRAAAQYDIVIIALHLSNNRASAGYGISAFNTSAMNALIQIPNRKVVCFFGNAFALEKLPQIRNANAVLMAYQQTDYLQEAAAMAIFGAIPVSGSLPVTVNEVYNYGMGIKTESLGRLSYGVPEMVGLNRNLLQMQIDSVVQSGLNAKAYPGAVVQVAKDGRVIFQKAYGYHRYEDDQGRVENETMLKPNESRRANDAMDIPVEQQQQKINSVITTENEKGKMKADDIFDLASVTKIAATALALMQWTSTGKINPDQSAGELVPSLKQSNKSDLSFRDMLTHRSGLQAWIPFWKYAIDTTSTVEKALISRPDLNSKIVYQKKKPGFFKRLFGKKEILSPDYAASFKMYSDLWNQLVTPSTISWRKHTFSFEASEEYSVKISEKLWMNPKFRDEVFNLIKDSPVTKNQGYVYSDLHYYYYPQLSEHLSGTALESFLQQTYQALGASTLGYNPLNKFSEKRIVPTEYDSLFRQTLLHGMVHDEGAAITGGVSGHAGLFGNANDIMKLAQMYLQKGYYGGIQFIHPEVINSFTSYQFPEEKNRRGLAFDKPSLDGKTINAPTKASPESYGHSGYTGTYLWIDPEYNLSYVFLSNRVYPTRNNNKISELNIRPSIGDAIYRVINVRK